MQHKIIILKFQGYQDLMDMLLFLGLNLELAYLANLIMRGDKVFLTPFFAEEDECRLTINMFKTSCAHT